MALTESPALATISPVVKALFNGAAWGWFDLHQDDTVIQILLWKRTVKDLEPLFVDMFGPRP